ncbi:MAG TPA: hypothetical protein VJL54_00245 [Nitrososphaera sp.]|nr:hypothetical protein [Nitrososphaera sp.]
MLRRGHILLIGGSAAIVVGLAMVSYYAVRLIEALEGETYTAEPGSSAEISRNFTSSETGGQAGYLVSVATLDGDRPMITVRGPDGQVILQRTVDQPFMLEPFNIGQNGTYSLTVSNPSADSSLEVGMILDSLEGLLGRGAMSPVLTGIFWLVFVAGVGAAVAGAFITVMDRRRISKMKKFGDMSDLV